jgi:hypothetical protein
MRKCCLDAGLIDQKVITNLEFTTEREQNFSSHSCQHHSQRKGVRFIDLQFLFRYLAEAAAIYCREFCKDYQLKEGG